MSQVALAPHVVTARQASTQVVEMKLNEVYQQPKASGPSELH